MSDVTQDGATNAPQDATNADASATQAPPVTELENGAAADAGDASLGDGPKDAPEAEIASSTEADAGDPNASTGEDPVPGSDESASAGSLLAEVESLAYRAFQSGRTDEHNLMAWLHSHLTGAQKIVHGSDHLELSDEARAVIVKVKGLL